MTNSAAPFIDLAVQVVAAFAGAFFAFLFIRLADFLTACYERQLRHCTGLVRVVHLTNDYYNRSISCKRVIDDFIRITAVGHMAVRMPPPFLSDRDVAMTLLDSDLRERVYELNLHVDRLNTDLATLRDAYNLNLQARLTGSMSHEEFHVRAMEVSVAFAELRQGVVLVDDAAKDVWSRAEARSRRDLPIGAQWMLLLVRPRGLSEDDAAKARSTLESNLAKKATRLGAA